MTKFNQLFSWGIVGMSACMLFLAPCRAELQQEEYINVHQKNNLNEKSLFVDASFRHPHHSSSSSSYSSETATLSILFSYSSVNVIPTSTVSLTITPVAVDPKGHFFEGAPSTINFPIVDGFLQENLNPITIPDPKKGIYTVGYIITVASGFFSEPFGAGGFFAGGITSGSSTLQAIPLQSMLYSAINNNAVVISGQFDSVDFGL